MSALDVRDPPMWCSTGVRAALTRVGPSSRAGTSPGRESTLAAAADLTAARA